MDTGPLVAERVYLLHDISFESSSPVLSILLNFPIDLSEFWGGCIARHIRTSEGFRTYPSCIARIV